jgi:hypothetical protein
MRRGLRYAGYGTALNVGSYRPDTLRARWAGNFIRLPKNCAGLELRAVSACLRARFCYPIVEFVTRFEGAGPVRGIDFFVCGPGHWAYASTAPQDAIIDSNEITELKWVETCTCVTWTMI